MPSIDWNKLDSPCPLVAWSILTQKISDVFFSGTLLAVPYIDQANDYDLMVCFSKISHFWQRTTTFRLLGHFLDISAPAKKNQKQIELLEILRNPLKEDLNSTYYSYTWADNNNNKSITIKMSGLSKSKVNWNLKQGSLVLDLCDKSVYVISEVVRAEEVIIDVQVNKRNTSEKKTMKINNIPVAFSYLKFPVDKNGVLLAAKDTKVKLDASFVAGCYGCFRYGRDFEVTYHL